MTFATDTAVHRIDEGRWTATIEPGWDIAGNANGGYLLSIAMRAVLDATDRPHPVTVTSHYLRPGRPGPAAVDVEVVKAGRSFTTARATLYSLADGQETPLMAVLATCGSLDGEPHPAELVTAEPPVMPPFADCVRMEATDGFPPPFMARVDLRLHPDDAFVTGHKSGEARIRGWFTLPELGDGDAVDVLGLVQATDAFPPTIFNTDLPVAWVPTVELTSHIRAVPAPGPLRCIFTTRFVTGGFLEEDGEVWDSAGRLVAQSRQLALTPRG